MQGSAARFPLWGNPQHWSLRVLIAWIVAAAFLVLAHQPAVAQIQPGGTCVNDVTNQENNCTANDVRISSVEVLSGSTDPICSSPEDTVDVLLRARLVATANTRYDIGIFVSQDGGDAYSGQCARGYLTPISANNSDVNVTGGFGPFYNGEIGTADTCGDIQQGVVTYYNLLPITLPCRDSDGDGYLDIGSIVGWDNAKHMCTNLNQAIPTTKAKCNADPALKIPIVVPPGKVDIVKAADEPVVLAGSQIGFRIGLRNSLSTPATNVRITDTLHAGMAWQIDPSADSAACSISSSVLTCNWGTLGAGQTRLVHVIAQTSLANCGPIGNTVDLTYLSGSPAVLKTGRAKATTGVSCSTIEVDKVTAPAGSGQPFTFTLTASDGVSRTFSLTDPQEAYVSPDLTPTLTYALAELPAAGWLATDATCDNGEAPISINPVSSPGPGEPQLGITVRCTFTNTQLASVEVTKTVVGATGLFEMALNGGDRKLVLASPAAPGSVRWSDLLPGDYTISEAFQGDRWLAGTFACTIFTPGGGQRSDDASFTLAAGEHAACTITNTRRGRIAVSKLTEPASTDEFGFTASFGPAFTLVDGQTHLSPLLDPGTYTVSETLPLPPGWDQVAVSCSDGSAPGAIDLGPGELVVCTYTNRLRSSLTVVKQTEGFGDNFDGTFAFTSTGGLTTTNPFSVTTVDTQASVLFTDLISGTYSVGELPPGSDWKLLSASCTGSSSADPAALAIGPGEDVTCTFVNQKLVPGMQLQKQVTTMDDPACANAEDFIRVPLAATVQYCFTLYNTGNVTIAAPITLSDPQIGIGLVLPIDAIAPGTNAIYTATHNWGGAAGSYPNTATVTGTTSAGNLTDSDDAQVAMPETGLIVRKFVGPAGGPHYSTTRKAPYVTDAGSMLEWRWVVTNTSQLPISLVVSDTLDGAGFDLVADGGCASPLPTQLEPEEAFVCTSTPFPAAAGLNLNIVQAGGCTIDEVIHDCMQGEDSAAYVTRPQLLMTKVVSNTWGGILGVPDFPLRVASRTAITPLTSGITVTLDAGTYALLEQQQPGYTSTGFTGNCSANGKVNLANGDVKSCTITNTDTPAKLTVVKVIVADRYEDSFDIYLNGTLLGSADSAASEFGPVTIISGTHTIAESGPLDEYAREFGGDCDSTGSLHASIGQSYLCTITNTQLANIVLVKETIPTGSGQAFTFTASYTTTTLSLVDGGSIASGYLAPGTYAVDETVPAGWEQIGTACSNGSDPSEIALGAGETVTCTFTNRQMGQIRIQKVLDPPLNDVTFGFTASYAPDGFTLGHGESHTSAFLPPEVYTVTEVSPLPVGWVQTGFECSDGSSDPDDLNLDPGELLICTVTNTLERGQIIVQKFTDPLFSLQQFTMTANFTGDFALTGPGPGYASGPLLPASVQGATYAVAELTPDGWQQVSAYCYGNQRRSIVFPDDIDLLAGEIVTCNFYNAIDRGQIIVAKVTDPAGSPQPFTFTTGFGDTFQLLGGESIASGQTLLPSSESGLYSVAETLPTGWVQLGATCSNGSQPSAISLAPGETVTCTFGNQQLLPAVQLLKQVTTIDDPTCLNAADALTVTAGAQVQYCFTVRNSGNLTITAPITLADPLLGLAVVLPTSELAPGASTLYTATFNWGSEPGSYPNSAAVTGTTILGTVTDPDDALVTVQPLPTGLVDGTVYIDVDGDGIYTPGTDQPLPAVTVVVTDSAGITYSLATGPDGYFNQVVPPGATVVTIDERTLSGGLILTIGGTNPSTVVVPANGVATDNTGYVYMRLALSKRLAPSQDATVHPGDDVNYSIVVTNESVISLTNVLVTEHIPDQLELSPNDDNGWTLSADGRTATQIIPAMAPNEVVTLPIVMRAVSVSSEPVVNRVTAGDNEDEREIEIVDPTGLDDVEEPAVTPRLYLPLVSGE